MSLLKPKQKNCAICDSPLKGMWNRKISGGTYVCRDCIDLMRVDSLRIPYLSLSEATKKVEAGRANRKKHEEFTLTNEAIAVDYRFRYDANTREWYITNSAKQFNPQIYKIEDIRSCKLLENGTVVWEKDFRIPSKTYESPDYLEYARMYSYRFFFDIIGMEEFLEIELITDNANDVMPGSKLYYAYQEEAREWTNLLDSILN